MNIMEHAINNCSANMDQANEEAMIPDAMAMGLIPEAETNALPQHVLLTQRALSLIHRTHYIPIEVRAATLDIMATHIERRVEKIIGNSVQIIKDTIEQNPRLPTVDLIRLATDQLAPNVAILDVNRVRGIALRMMATMGQWQQQLPHQTALQNRYGITPFDPLWPEVAILMTRGGLPDQNLVQLFQIWHEILRPSLNRDSLRMTLGTISEVTVSILNSVLETSAVGMAQSGLGQ